MTSNGPEEKEAVSPYVGRMSYKLDEDLLFEDELVSLGYAIWRNARAGNTLPSRSDFDPLNLPSRLLPHILLVDVVEAETVRLRWRLVGTYITERVGRDMTGRYWDEIYDIDVLNEISKAPLWVLENRRPIRAMGAAPMEDKNFLISENLFAPLSSDGENINMLLAVSVLN